MILGITGGVGSGKSTVLDYLKSRYGAFLIQCDDVARQLQQPGGECYGPMLELFQVNGDALLHEDGSFNRSALAGRVFADEGLRIALNRIVHPAVKRAVNETIRANAKRPLIVIEAALLLEDHYDEICDEIWYVYAKEAVRRQRLKDSRGYSDEKIDEIFQSQRSEESFRANCSVTIDNSSENLQNTYRQLDQALSERGIVQNPGKQEPDWNSTVSQAEAAETASTSERIMHPS